MMLYFFHKEGGDKKMKKVLTALMVFCAAAALGTAFAAIGVKVVDNFENNLDLKTPEWWRFDNVTTAVEKNPAFRPGDSVAKSCGKYSMVMKGSARDWYCGGTGTYVGLDASSYTGLEVCVFGYGEGSGRLKIELYDDDKGSWETKYDKEWKPIKDDMWIFEQNVDWRGWKKVYIPFSSFTLFNPKRGDGKINFDQSNGSGGLLQIQFILIAGSKDGEANVRLDNIQLVTRQDEYEE